MCRLENKGDGLLGRTNKPAVKYCRLHACHDARTPTNRLFHLGLPVSIVLVLVVVVLERIAPGVTLRMGPMGHMGLMGRSYKSHVSHQSYRYPVPTVMERCQTVRAVGRLQRLPKSQIQPASAGQRVLTICQGINSMKR